MSSYAATKAYSKVEIESGALGADPHKLVSMLYQGALLAIANAKNSMLRKDIGAKCTAISKAAAIIDEGLNASLDKKAGGELAENLSALYDYMCTRLIQANIKGEMGALDEVARLLNDLKGAWDGIRPTVVPASVATAAAVQTVTPAVVPEKPASMPTVAPQQQRVMNKVQSLYGRV